MGSVPFCCIDDGQDNEEIRRGVVWWVGGWCVCGGVGWVEERRSFVHLLDGVYVGNAVAKIDGRVGKERRLVG